MSDTTVTLQETAANLKQVRDFFVDGTDPGYTSQRFTADWKALDNNSKNQIKNGIGNGTFNY